MHSRILKMIATSGFLTALECIKFVFPRPPSWFKGTLLLRGGEGKRRKGAWKGRAGEGREGEHW